MAGIMADEGRIKAVTIRYQGKVFAFGLYLTGGDRDEAYDIAVSAFTRAFMSEALVAGEKKFLMETLKEVLTISKKVKIPPKAGIPLLTDPQASEEGPLAVIVSALLSLPVEERALVLLRDQLHMCHRCAAYITNTSEQTIMVRTEQAREKLRGKIEEALSHGA